MQTPTPFTRASVRRPDGRRERVEVHREPRGFVVTLQSDDGRRRALRMGDLAGAVTVCAAAHESDDAVAASLAAGLTAAADPESRRWFAAHHALRVARQTCRGVPAPPRGPDLGTLAAVVAADLRTRLDVEAEVATPVGWDRAVVDVVGREDPPFRVSFALSADEHGVAVRQVADVLVPDGAALDPPA